MDPTSDFDNRWPWSAIKCCCPKVKLKTIKIKISITGSGQLSVHQSRQSTWPGGGWMGTRIRKGVGKGVGKEQSLYCRDGVQL